jgi:hypothetical protein
MQVNASVAVRTTCAVVGKRRCAELDQLGNRFLNRGIQQPRLLYGGKGLEAICFQEPVSFGRVGNLLTGRSIQQKVPLDERPVLGMLE